MSNIITLTTDFRSGSAYVAQMKGVILAIHPAVTIVDICHDIPPQDVRHGAICLGDAAPHFPRGTIHVAVVDPGVGSDREIVYVRSGGHAYIAPDNGLLSRVVELATPTDIIALSKRKFWRDQVSSTFHGRDIMAPVAAHICAGSHPEEMGERRESLVTLSWPAVQLEPRRIRGTIMQIDSFGNLISNITREHMNRIPADATPCISSHNHQTRALVDHYSQQPRGTFVALMGSSGRLELSICGGHAGSALSVRAGDSLEVSW